MVVSDGKDPKTGRFVKGHAYKPPRKGNRNDKRGREYSDAIANAVTPDLVVQLIEETVTMARKRQSSRTMLQVLTLALAYGAGRPAYRIANDDGVSPQDWAEVFADDKEEDGEGPGADDSDAAGTPGRDRPDSGSE